MLSNKQNDSTQNEHIRKNVQDSIYNQMEKVVDKTASEHFKRKPFARGRDYGDI